MTRVLENNLNPATHFIEVCSLHNDYGYLSHKPEIIDELDDWLLQTNWLRLNTIAIFKIRMKPH